MGTTYEVDVQHPPSGVLDAACAVLRDGGLVVYPSDTVYSIVSATRVGDGPAGGIQRLYDLKHRNKSVSFPWIVASISSLEVLGTELSDEAFILAEEFWPGGLTLVVRASAAVPRLLMREDATVALRVPASPIAAALVRATGVPLLSTGANLRGNAAPLSSAELEPAVTQAVEMVLDAGSLTLPGPPTMVDCAHGSPTILHEGIVSREQIEQALGFAVPVM